MAEVCSPGSEERKERAKKSQHSLQGHAFSGLILPRGPSLRVSPPPRAPLAGDQLKWAFVGISDPVTIFRNYTGLDS